MKSIIGGIVIMVIVAFVGGSLFNATFSQTAGETHVSQNGSVRLGN
ncbi:MAG: hypothetical protein ABJN04_07260 [Hyphomicrobiales bacterium]